MFFRTLFFLHLRSLFFFLFGSLFNLLDFFLLRFLLFNFFFVDYWFHFINFSEEMAAHRFEINLIVDSLKFLLHSFKTLLLFIILFFKITKQWLWFINHSFKQLFLLNFINLLLLLDIFKEVSGKFVTFSLIILVQSDNIFSVLRLFSRLLLIFWAFNSVK